MKFDVDKVMETTLKWVEFNMNTPVRLAPKIPEHAFAYVLLAQGRGELRKFLEVLSTLDNREIALEIGIFYGGTFAAWSQIFNHVIGMDIDKNACDFVDKRLDEFGCPSKKYFIAENSQSSMAKYKLKELLGDRKLSFLFIDGAHSYEALKLDFENYVHLVKSGGIIGIHDVGGENTPHTSEEVFVGLNKYAMEISKNNYKYDVSLMSFIHFDHGGIGWCVKK